MTQKASVWRAARVNEVSWAKPYWYGIAVGFQKPASSRPRGWKHALRKGSLVSEQPNPCGVSGNFALICASLRSRMGRRAPARPPQRLWPFYESTQEAMLENRVDLHFFWSAV